jgi:gliding motility-associated-like protein
VIWSKDYDLTVSPCEIADKVLRLPNGYLLVGYTNQFGAPLTKHLFALATDLNGNQLWAKIYGNANTGTYDYYDSSSMVYIMGNTIYIAATQDNGTNTDIDFIATDLDGNIACAPPVSTPVVQSNNPQNSTTCNMTYLPATLLYSSNSLTDSRAFPDQCSANQVHLGNDTIICGTYLLDAAKPGATYQWQDGSTQPSFIVQGPGTYWVTENINCCVLSDTITFLPCSYLSVPNVFTPNNDGSNDFFLVSTEGIEALDVKIYDRWGVLMAELTSPQQGWNGKAKNGKDAVDGTYYYVLGAKGSDLKEYKASGFFTLIR